MHEFLRLMNDSERLALLHVCGGIAALQLLSLFWVEGSLLLELAFEAVVLVKVDRRDDFAPLKMVPVGGDREPVPLADHSEALLLHRRIAVMELREDAEDLRPQLGKVAGVVALLVAQMAVDLLLAKQPLNGVAVVRQHADVQRCLAEAVLIVEVCAAVHELARGLEVLLKQELHQDSGMVRIFLVQVVGS